MAVQISGEGWFRDTQGMALSLRNVSKRFGETEVLHSLYLTVEPGEFVAIVGKSGCGKSTLLRLVAGVETPSTGAVQVDDQAQHGLNSTVRMMFQEARLLPWKRVLANVALGLTTNARPRAEQALRQVGLLDRASDWPGILSGGQKQRVALARALASEPHILLLDEPLGALDALTRIEMQRLIEAIWQERHVTTLLVTHDVEEAVALADRILIMEAGRIVQQVSVGLSRPRHRSDPAFGELEARVLNRIMAAEERQERRVSLV